MNEQTTTIERPALTDTEEFVLGPNDCDCLDVPLCKYAPICFGYEAAVKDEDGKA